MTVLRKLGKCQGANYQSLIEVFTDNFSFRITFMQEAHPKRLLKQLNVKLEGSSNSLLGMSLKYLKVGIVEMLANDP